MLLLKYSIPLNLIRDFLLAHSEPRALFPYTSTDGEEKAAEDAAEKARREQEAEKLRKADADRVDASREKKYGAGRSLVQKPVMTAQERIRKMQGK